MPFVRRDENGKVAAMFYEPEGRANEELPARHEDLVKFMEVTVKQVLDTDECLQADLTLVRVTEDLIDVLIENGTFAFTDLTGRAQNKLNNWQGLPSEIFYLEALFGSDEDNFL